MSDVHKILVSDSSCEQGYSVDELGMGDIEMIEKKGQFPLPSASSAAIPLCKGLTVYYLVLMDGT